jgi:hypothetical protein
MECFRKQTLKGPVKTTGSFLFVVAAMNIAFCCYACQDPGSNTVVSIQGGQWLTNGKAILAGSPAEGLLVNVRVVNAVFEDVGPAAQEHLPKDFTPDENTDRFISKIPDYYNRGVRAFTISLQGGMPGYEGAVNTAFNPDGSLKQEYLDRVADVIRAADKKGAVLILSCFYQRQHSNEFALDGKSAILKAVENVARWIHDKKFSNVVLEISNEFSHGGYNKWKDGDWLRSVDGQVELIRHVKRFAPNLLVSTSGMGNGLVPEPIATEADYVILHFNRTPLNLIPERVKQARAYGKPVLCNEDDKVGKVGAEAARLSISAGAGWGFMHIEKNQTVPFVFDGAKDDTVVYKMLQNLTTPGASIADIAEEPLSIVITQPVDGDVFVAGEAVTIRAKITGIEHSDEISVQIVAADRVIGKLAPPSWEFFWKDPDAGKYDIVAVVRDQKGVVVLRSGPADFEVRADSGRRKGIK